MNVDRILNLQSIARRLLEREVIEGILLFTRKSSTMDHDLYELIPSGTID